VRQDALRPSDKTDLSMSWSVSPTSLVLTASLLEFLWSI